MIFIRYYCLCFDFCFTVSVHLSSGPRLPEKLDVRNVPVTQMRNLTIELSGK